MSDRDKKLLVYLGALIILAAAYFLVGKPFLDKIDQLSAERTELDSTLRQKRDAFENKEKYQTGIEEANNEIREILDKFPEDNSDEKSIMFIHKAENEIPIWVSKIQFAEEIQSFVNGQDPENASDVEEAQLEENVAAAEEENTDETSSGRGAEGEEAPQENTSILEGLKSKDTELGVDFTSKYDETKKLLAYIRDYEDRLVIKEIELSYDDEAELVHGTLILSQYALIGEGRVLPKVETDVENLGTENIFDAKEKGRTILDIAADIAKDLFDRITGGVSKSEAVEETDADYFLKVNAVTDNTSGKTIGKSNDLQQTSYTISDRNKKEKVIFEVNGAEGHYTVKYSIGKKEKEDSIEKESDQTITFKVISTERMSETDDVSVSLHVINSSDIPVNLVIEGDDENDPRIKIVEQDGDITVK